MDIEWQQNVVEVNKPNVFRRYWRYILMIFIIGSFFVVELVCGMVIGSLVVQADAFHMLSDLLALIIALISFKLTFLPSSETATFGYKRADVIGGLINGVYLLSTCFFIFLESIQKLVDWQQIGTNFGNVDLMLIIGGIGLAVNIFGIVLFSVNCKKDYRRKKRDDDSHSQSHSHSHSHDHHSDDSHSQDHHGHMHAHDHGNGHSHHDMNVKALLLHMFGDMLGSISVMISGFIIKYVPGNIKYIADPIASLIIVVILVITSIPIIKQCYQILAQTVPVEIDLPEIKNQLLQIDGVVEIHDFHIWQLTGKRYIGSMHVKLLNDTPLHNTIDKIQRIMHSNGIHATTIQPEISEIIPTHRESCNDLVCENKKCKDSHCCD